uniref:Poly(A) polymerase n=2 Tax=Solanum tuberosum TaxID=4113 RepID=M0ZMF6_SOLTU
MRKVVEVIFDVLIGDVRSLKTRRNSFEIDYTLLGKGQTRETRFVLGKVILDTIAPGVIPGSEVMKHTLVKVDAQLSKNAPKENMDGNVKLKKRKFACEDDNQPNASSEIKHNRDEKLNTVIAKQSKEKAVEKHDNESLSQKLDNGDAVTKKKSKGEQSELPQNGTRMVLEAMKHPVPSHKKEQKGGNKYQQTSANHLKLIHNVDNGATTKQHKLKEKRDSSQEQKEEKSESLHSRKHDLKGGKLASDEKSKPKAGNQTLSDLFRR